MNPFLRFLAAARSLANQGMSKEAIEQFAKNEFGKINTMMQKQINNIFKPKKPVGKKDEVFDSTVEKMQFDDAGKPFNPRNPTKDYSKKAEGGIMRVGLKLGTNELRQMAMEMFGTDDLRLLSRDELDQLREAFDIKKGRVEEADGGRIGLAAGTMPSVIMRLVRGFMKVTGRKPNKDEMEKILFEAADKDIGKMASDDYAMKVGGGLKAIKRRTDEIDRSKLSKMVDDIEFAQGGRAGFKEGKGMFEELFFSKDRPILSGLNTAALFDLVVAAKDAAGPLIGFADGGRIGYKNGPDQPGRRKFMKIAGGILGAIPFVGTKILSKATPVISKTAELTGPALDKIVDTVMSLGKFVSLKGKRVKDMVTKKKHEGVEVTEDVADQSYIIKKGDKEIYYKPGRQDETGGFEDDIIEVIEERVKKASGGIGYMLGE
jgi:hypothetical protein